ncbi:MAG TPA: BatA domain-containing protein [Gemmatimonadaceae bacterium]
MSFLAPGFLIASAVAAIGIIALHFIVTRRPRSVAFPTARFVPDVPIAARARSYQLSDLLLLIVRVLPVLLVGAALGRPVFPPRRERIVRVIVADVSGAVANVAGTRDSVRALFRAGDAIVAFDTAARSVASPDSVVAAASMTSSGSLSAGLVAALRAGSRVRDGADSVELIVISPFTVAEHDRATGAIRAQWPGRVRLVAVAAATSTGSPQSSAQKPLFPSASRPIFAVTRSRIDTIGAVVAQGNVVIASFERRWRFTRDSMAHSRVIARWADGEPAAIERDSAATCIRSSAVPVDSAGDMLLRPSFIRLRASLSAPCEPTVSAPDAALATMIAGTGHLARTAQFLPAQGIDSPLGRWLVAMAMALAIAEMVLRQSRDDKGER